MRSKNKSEIDPSPSDFAPIKWIKHAQGFGGELHNSVSLESAMPSDRLSFLRATEFEFRHQTLIRLSIVGAAFLTYVYDRDDIVWRFIKNSGPHTRITERVLFLIATVLIGISACICTVAYPVSAKERSAPASIHLFHFGELLYALGLSFLAQLSGFIILVIGESLRLLRLLHNDRTFSFEAVQDSRRGEWRVSPGSGHPLRRETLSASVRSEAMKWGIFVTMIVFTITLKDRYAEALIGVSILLWMVLKLGTYCFTT